MEITNADWKFGYKRTQAEMKEEPAPSAAQSTSTITQDERGRPTNKLQKYYHNSMTQMLMNVISKRTMKATIKERFFNRYLHYSNRMNTQHHHYQLKYRHQYEHWTLTLAHRQHHRMRSHQHNPSMLMESQKPPKKQGWEGGRKKSCKQNENVAKAIIERMQIEQHNKILANLIIITILITWLHTQSVKNTNWHKYKKLSLLK